MNGYTYSINLHPYEYIEGLRYYPFAVTLDRCMWSCNTLNDLSNKVWVPNKTEDLDLNLSVCNTITGINVNVNVNINLMVENVTRIKSIIMINVGVSAKIQKNIIHMKKIIFGVLLHVVV